MKIASHTPNTSTEKEIWSYLNEHQQVTHEDLRTNTSASNWQRQNYLAKLKRLGILKECGRRGTTRIFTVMDDKSAAEFDARRRKTIWGAMWTAMRISSVFTQADLSAAIASAYPDATPEKVHKYCAMLLRADYLAVIVKAKSGVSPARYKLVNDTGPLPPVIRKLECLVDPNEERAVYVQGGRQ